jgi:hypothetical protein
VRDVLVVREWSMSDSEWSALTDPHAMLAFLRDHGPVSRRKLNLFGVAVCRRFAHLLPDDRCGAAVDALERRADGAVGEAEYGAAWSAAGAAAVETAQATRGEGPGLAAHAALTGWVAGYALDDYGPDSASAMVSNHERMAEDAGSRMDLPAEQTAVCEALRCIFGNPFAPITFLPEWRTEVVVDLSRGIYEERAWSRMPVLADALDDAGAAPELVWHCREPGVHTRGCHVLDATLDRF